MKFYLSDIHIDSSYTQISPASPSNADGQPDSHNHYPISNIPGLFDVPCDLVDVAPVPEAYLTELGDHVDQCKVLENIISTTLYDPANSDPFNKKSVYGLKHSMLERLYKNGDPCVLDLLSNCHKIMINKHFKLEFGKHKILLDTFQIIINYQLIITNSIGFGILLSNAASNYRFSFNMELEWLHKVFKGKHGMVGFDTKG